MSRKNPFQMEIEKKFGNNTYDLDAFMRGHKKLNISKQYIKDTYNMKLEDFAYYAESVGFRVMLGSDDILIFK